MGKGRRRKKGKDDFTFKKERKRDAVGDKFALFSGGGKRRRRFLRREKISRRSGGEKGEGKGEGPIIRFEGRLADRGREALEGDPDRRGRG